MTSGSRSSGLDPGTHDFTGVGFRKTWSGTDGRTEISDGFLRTKWNDYTMSVRSRLRPSAQWDVYSRYVGPDDGQSHPLWHDGLEDFGVSHFVDPNIHKLEFDSNDELKLLNKLQAKVKNHEFNLSVSLGELKDFVPMVADRLTKIAKAVRAIKRGDFATAARQFGSKHNGISVSKTGKFSGASLRVGDIPSVWLEMQYGWLPSLNDIFEAAKAFETLSKGPRKSLVTVSAKKFSVFNACTTPEHMEAMVRQTYKRYITYEMTEELSAPRQLGLIDPRSLVWELLPWSFVVDWSLPIGDYLDALATIPHLKGRFLRTDVRKYDGYFGIKYLEGTHKWGSDWITYAVPPFPTYDTLRATEMERTVLGALTVPTPTFKSWKQISGPRNRLANATSLLYSAFASETITLKKKRP